MKLQHLKQKLSNSFLVIVTNNQMSHAFIFLKMHGTTYLSTLQTTLVGCASLFYDFVLYSDKPKSSSFGLLVPGHCHVPMGDPQGTILFCFRLHR